MRHQWVDEPNFEKVDTSFLHTKVNKDSLQSYFQSVKSNFSKQGYLAASVDSFTIDTSICNAYIYIGPKMIVQFQNDSTMSSEVSNQFQWVEEQNDYINEQANSGFPLEKIYITDQEIINDTLRIHWINSKGDLITWDSIKQKNDNVLSQSFLHNYLFIKKGKPFELEKVSKIENRLKNLNYIKLQSPPTLEIQDQKADIILDIQPVNASVFDFLIGVLPNFENEERQFTISGELNAHLRNKLKQGEEIKFHFRQLRPETQKIELLFRYPYIANLPIGMMTSFQLYKFENKTIDLNARIGATYLVENNFQSSFYTEYSSSRIIEIDTQAIIENKKLPDNLDVTSTQLGVLFEQQQLDYVFNPRKGFTWQMDVSFGSRNIIPNALIQGISTDSIDFQNAYDTLNLNSLQANIEGNFAYFFPIRKRSTFKLETHLGYKWTNGTLFLNEYYRMGGAGDIRGFDEESIQGKFYSYLTAEFRYLLSQNSYFSVFADYGWLRNDYLTERNWNQTIGGGIGLSFQTNAGIFEIDVALGRQLNNPVDFRNTKTHFGFVALF